MKWKNVYASSKYKAKATRIDNIRFASKKEAHLYQQLLWAKKAGEVTRIVLQPRFSLLSPFTRKGETIRGITYVADFLVAYKDGTHEVIDVKGYRTASYKIKKKLFLKEYPQYRFREC